MKQDVCLGVPAPKASPSGFPLQVRAPITGLAGFPLQSVTRTKCSGTSVGHQRSQFHLPEVTLLQRNRIGILQFAPQRIELLLSEVSI